MTWTIIACIILFVAGAAFLLWRFYRKQRVMHTPDWAHQTTHRVPVYELNAWIEDAINARQLYRNPNMSAKQLAKELGLPVRQLKYTINYACNKTVAEYLNDKRIQVACRLLREKKRMSIDQISQQTGFASPKVFQKVFIRTMGQTPDNFRHQKG